MRHARADWARCASDGLARGAARSFLGRVEEVLVEERNVKRPTQLVGRTQTNRLVFFDGEIDELRGRLVNVRITEARKFSLSGELVR